MNPSNQSGGPRRSLFWLVPLVVGIALGGLFFSSFNGIGSLFDRRDRAAFSQRAPQTAAQDDTDRDADAAQRDRRGDMVVGGHRMGRDRDGGWGFGFWPFGGMRLLLPLLLLGAGAWLLAGRGRRGGPPAGAGPQPPLTQDRVEPTARAYDVPRADAPPSTGETRRL